MHITPATFIAKLLAAMQVLVTLDMPLSTTMALPVTSKPIESTVENLAWQAWIELPPEQKQQVKSRKVTPKSIFTLPLRVECPDGHKQVDTKCIPIAIGTNDVLIDLSALGLLVGTTQTEDLYDYDDMGEEMTNPLPFGGEMSIVEAESSGEGLTVALKPPAKDEPLKFNIFESKFNIFQEEPLEDYSSFSYDGLQSSEKEQNVMVTTPQTTNESSISTANVTAINDLVSQPSNITENNFEFYVQQEKNSSLSDSHAEESKNFSALANDEDFKIDAISVPAFSFKLPVRHNESSIELVTAMMDTEATTTIDGRNKAPESDIQTLLQTESFLPLLNQTTATTLQNSVADENYSLTTVPLQAPSESSADVLSLNIDEEITTLPNVMDQDIELKNKQEFTRSINYNLTLNQDNEIVDAGNDNGDNEQSRDLTLESLTTNDEPLETTTPMHLDETTIIETHSSLSTTPSTQQELKALLLQQEQALKDFEELQRRRKGQKDQHLVFKKSKVQPVEVLSTTTEATTKTKTTTAADADAVTTSANLPTATKSEDELISTSTAETVTPLLTVHNENDNNDRFYYQHFAKQDNVVRERSGSKLKQKITTAAAEASTAVTTTKSSEIQTIPLTSEIDLAEELRIINELVKGIRPATMLTKTQTTTTTTTTEKPTVTTGKAILINSIKQSTLSFNSPSESSSGAFKPSLSTSQIWSRIIPLLTTSSTTPMPKSTTDESFNKSSQEELSETTTTTSSSISWRSNRNSKIIRINGFNSISAAKTKATDYYSTTATTPATPTILEESTSSLPVSSSSDSSSTTTSSEQQRSSTESGTYKPYWWLPLTWSVNKPTNSDEQPEQQEVKSEEPPLLLRFWSAYASESS